MRTLIAILILSLASQFVFAQKNFEGKITYQNYLLTKEKKDSFPLAEVYFGDRKLKLSYKEIENENKISYSIIANFAEKLLYRIDFIDKSYSKDSLRKLSEFTSGIYEKPIGYKRLLGYGCTGFTKEEKIFDTSTGFSARLLAWYADSLHFSFDADFARGDLLKFTNGKSISLLAEEIITMFDTIKVKDGMEASKVEPMKIEDSIFNIPESFSLKQKPIQNSKVETLELIDVQMAEVKQEDSPPPPPPPPPLPPKQKSKAKKIYKKQ